MRQGEKGKETLRRSGKILGITWLAGSHDFLFSIMCVFRRGIGNGRQVLSC